MWVHQYQKSNHQYLYTQKMFDLEAQMEIDMASCFQNVPQSQNNLQ